MPQLSLSNFSENLPVSGSIAVTQAAAGCGLGLLIADKMSGKARRQTSAFLLAAGVVMLVPVIASFVSRVRNRPHSRRRTEQQLASIREDIGFADSESIV